jgi:hypothetical protein
MTYEALGYLKKNSPPATLTASMESTDNSATVDHLEYFHNSTGGLITKGIVIGPGDATKIKPEEITITAASTTSGPGDLTGITRGVHADGTIGVASSWDSGTEIAVNYSYGRDKQIADNFEAHATLITARATKTIATTSVYVDSAATGAGTGVDWTNAFTTIQAAINSLPAILCHAITIYVRKGSTAYGTLNTGITVSSIVAQGGSLEIRGEYYWVGACAEASTPGTEKFNVTAADGANIAAGDCVVLSHGTTTGISDLYIKTTVASVTDKGSNVYEVTLTDAYGGTISTSDYYRIVKTEVDGYFSVYGDTVATITGLYFPQATSSYTFVLGKSTVTILYCINNISGGTGRGISADLGAIIYIGGCYIAGSANAIRLGGYASCGAQLYISSAGYDVNVIKGNVLVRSGSAASSAWSAYVGTGTAITAESLSYVNLISVFISSTYTTGILASGNSVVKRTTVTNNATTPLNPASSTDNPVII